MEGKGLLDKKNEDGPGVGDVSYRLLEEPSVLEEPSGGARAKQSSAQRVGCVVAMVLFNFLLVLLTAPVYFVAVAGSALVHCAPRCQGCLSHVLIAMASFEWRLTLRLCCWIHVHADGLQEFRDGFSSADRPVVLLSNHTSFLDTILSVSFLPLARAGRVKMLAANSIFRMPFLGTIVKAMGHLKVPFKQTRTENRSMAVDNDVMGQVMKELEVHLQKGNAAAWYAEGRMNLADIRQVQTFRAGGLALPVHVDTEIWCAAYIGNSVCWPPLAKVGGYPARIGVKCVRLCESSHAFLAGNCPGQDERAKMVYLANSAHGLVQSMVDALVAEGYSVGPPAQINRPVPLPSAA